MHQKIQATIYGASLPAESRQKSRQEIRQQQCGLVKTMMGSTKQGHLIWSLGPNLRLTDHASEAREAWN